MPSVSIVMPTRDRPDLLARSLAAVLEDEATSEVIVVMDGDDPEVRRLLERMSSEDRRVRVASVPDEPAGLGRVQRGRDHGVELAGSDVVLAMDDDVVAHPGMVSGHAARHADRDDIVVVGYMPVVSPRRWPRSHAPVQEYAEAYETICRAYAAEPDSILRQLWGGNVSVRRSHWLQAIQRPRVTSSLDEGAWLDDKELGLLLRKEGLEAVFDPNLRADHWYERSLRGLVVRAEKNCLGQAQLRAVHPEANVEVVDSRGEPAETESEHAGQNPALRALGTVARTRTGWFVVRWGLIAITSAAAALRISPIERKGTVALSALAWQRAERMLPPRLANVLR
jgi:glycosyltransferase involved in cell wall biosynthesis